MMILKIKKINKEDKYWSYLQYLSSLSKSYDFDKDFQIFLTFLITCDMFDNL